MAGTLEEREGSPVAMARGKIYYWQRKKVGKSTRLLQALFVRCSLTLRGVRVSLEQGVFNQGIASSRISRVKRRWAHEIVESW